MDLQMDTVSLLSLELVEATRDRMMAAAETDPAFAPAVGLMVEWDGDYTVDSRAAPVFEAFANAFLPESAAALALEDEYAAYTRLGRDRRLLLDDLPLLDAAGWKRALTAGLTAAAEVEKQGTKWGDIHRMVVGHTLSRAPVLGSRYIEREFGVPGTRETIFKTSHDPTNDRHRSTFGAQSRHVSDMADPDANHFVLFGGQDGWIGSPAFADQVPLWRTGKLVQVPMTPEAVRRKHRISIVLRP